VLQVPAEEGGEIIVEGEGEEQEQEGRTGGPKYGGAVQLMLWV